MPDKCRSLRDRTTAAPCGRGQVKRLEWIRFEGSHRTDAACDMQDFRKIEAWQLSRPLVVAVYRASSRFPKEERFGLTLQVRKSVTSIGANIAEAMGRSTRADVARVLQHSVSEGNETLHHLLTAHDLGYLTKDDFENLLVQLEPVRTKTYNLLMYFRRNR
jgi:four helix bundle protein